MKRYDPRRADRRSPPDKLIGLIMALSDDDLETAQAKLDCMALKNPKSRAARTKLPTKG